jgi:hypothetical protein
MLPFSADEFFAVFAAYNEAVWPMQAVWYAVGLAATLLAMSPLKAKDRWIHALLGLLWAWSAVAYHFVQFARINPLAYAFSAGFLAQSAVFFLFSWKGRNVDYSFQADLRGWSGAGMVLYALILYPLLNMASGHAYPAAPTFGVPCPTVIFTLGLLCLSRSAKSRPLLAVPLLWSVVGGSAAFLLDVPPDLGLIVAGVTAGALAFGPNFAGRSQ